MLFQIPNDDSLNFTNGLAVRQYIAKYHWKTIKDKWEKKERHEISHKEWADYVHKALNETEIYEGQNHTRYGRRGYDPLEQELFTIMYPNINEKVVWINGTFYNHVFIKLGKATLKDLEDFLRLL